MRIDLLCPSKLLEITSFIDIILVYLIEE